MLQKVRPFTAADVEKVAEMFVSVPDGWSKTALEESLANSSIKSFVLEADGEIIGNIMYTKSRLIDKDGCEKPCLSFGPLSILPAYQRKGCGKMLVEHTFKAAAEMGYEVIVIFGNPDNYVGRGFKSSRKYNVCLEGDRFPAALLVKELKAGALDGRRWYFYESTCGEVCADEDAVAAFDAAFPPKEKCWQPSQEEFYIHSQSVMDC